MVDRGGAERRRYPRVKAKIPIEIHSDQSTSVSRSATDEVSLCGCYIETMFTLDIGAKVALTLSVNGEQICAVAVVATRYPQVGNGFDFVDMKPEDRLKLNDFIVACDRESAG
jgi:c-di-GMP-binding flagellar brake protein YcgR